MLEELEDLPAAARHSYLGRRLREALEFVERTGLGRRARTKN